MKCFKCKESETTIMVSMTVSMPSEYAHQLTKKKMLSKDFRIWGVNWEKADILCPKCGLIHTGI